MIDSTLTALGFSAADITWIEDDVAENVNSAYLKEKRIAYYTVTPAAEDSEDGNYTYIDLATMHPSHILNGVPTKSPDLDVTIALETSLATEVTDSADVEDTFMYGRHGFGILVENSDDAYTIKTIIADHVSSNVKDELINEFKALVVGLALMDNEYIINALRRISAIKSNILAEHDNEMPVVKRQSITVTPFEL